MKHFIFLSSAFILFFSACKKKDPVETSEPPVFSFTGKINGNAVSCFSGTDNYYMYSSYQTGSSNVREFVGTLKAFGCNSSCTNSFKLRIRDYRTLSSAPTDPDSSITPSFYAYSTPSGAPASYSITFTPQFTGGTPLSYLWTFHDGSTSTLSAPSKVYPHNGRYNVSLSITSTSSCTSSVYNTISLGQTGNIQIDCFSTPFPVSAVSFTPVALTGTPPFTYNWDFGDGNTSLSATPSHTYSTNGAYLVSLIMTDFSGRTGTVQKNVATQSPGTCVANFSTSSNALSNAPNFSNVIIEWTDANGITYTSENDNQPSTSSFQIKSVEEYKLNASSQKTKKIKASLNCTLYNGTSTVVVENAELVFAVAYP